ncbi:MAG: tRNA uridine-5-carboxymethylaminomethyl(34) synthesis GTPase MnmE [Paludibacteraceae bacterium]|nr:tRNA uridine-5-carboxymethylaminomethyl(34) synthesis GTPase MnmE [Paludibacteraceae bacterium]
MSTICAISTPAGVGGIAVIRISGPDAVSVCGNLFHGKKNLADCKSHTVHYGTVTIPEGSDIDDCVITVFRAPRSFTGEDTVEIACHGSVYIQQNIIKALLDAGCAMAQPGEFTQRAFLNGKMDLTKAEAVADLIASTSAAAHKVALNQMRGGFSKELGELRGKLLDFTSLLELELDFSEEDVEFANRRQMTELLDTIQERIGRLIKSFDAGNAIKNGIGVAIVGETNAGKSTLLNLLLGEEKAIVSDIHGTTRDTIEDTAVLDGYLFRFIDTAGIRETSDAIENIGIKRSYGAIEKADVVLWIIDSTSINEHIDWMASRIVPRCEGKQLILVFNKTDLISGDEIPVMENLLSDIDAPHVIISAKQGAGIEELKCQIIESAHLNDYSGDVIITNMRHYEALTTALSATLRVKQGLADGISSEFIAMDLHDCLDAIGSITGQIYSQDVLNNIFSKFCIGK